MGRHFGSKLSWGILGLIADGLEIFDQATRRPSAVLRYGLENVKVLDAGRERRRVQGALFRLKRQKLIREIHEGHRRAYRLTRLGQRYLATHMTVAPPQLPEFRRTVVSFDIPERFAQVRVALRSTLRQRGFRQLQRSVWISDLDWVGPLSEMFRQQKLLSWVYVFYAESLTEA